MTTRIRVLIVDDEPLARQGLRKLCEKDPELEVVGECADGRAALAALEQIEPDLLLLDVQMPGMDGFEVLQAVGRQNLPPVIFVTAYDQYALRAFEVHAVDYLLKPFSDKRFRDAIARTRQVISRAGKDDLRTRLLSLIDAIGLDQTTGTERTPSGSDSSTATEPGVSRIVVKEKGKIFFVPTDEIDWIEAADYYARIHVGDRVYLKRESMKSLAARLDSAQFFATSRSAIVNLDRIREIQPFFRSSQIVILTDGTRVTLSRSRRKELARLLGEPL